MIIIAVRHGLTEFNKDGRLMGGASDFGLNREGKEQARKLGDRLAAEQINFIYSSDLIRCLQTLEPFRQMNSHLPIKHDAQLRERDFGSYEGVMRDELDMDSITRKSLTARPPGGESLTDMKHRVNRFMKHLKDRHKGETVLLVTHGGVMRMMHHLFTRESLQESYDKFAIQNTAVCIYDLSERKPKVLVFNDISHL
jgi:probable phosphoglycerate mutase